MRSNSEWGPTERSPTLAWTCSSGMVLGLMETVHLWQRLHYIRWLSVPDIDQAKPMWSAAQKASQVLTKPSWQISVIYLSSNQYTNRRFHQYCSPWRHENNRQYHSLGKPAGRENNQTCYPLCIPLAFLPASYHQDLSEFMEEQDSINSYDPKQRIWHCKSTFGFRRETRTNNSM